MQQQSMIKLKISNFFVIIFNLEVEKPGEKKENGNVKVKLFNNNDAMDVDSDLMQNRFILFSDKI